MTTPWIEIEEVRDQELPAGPGSSEYVWQAMFACQVEVPPHQEWARLKWGWNVAALFDEAIERQKIFLESQYAILIDMNAEQPDRRTLALRFITQPEEGLLVSLIGKIQARTKADATECSLSYYSELKSTFPYDYILVPATSRQEFLRLSGTDLLENHQTGLAQIKRVELPIQPERNSTFLQGFWRSSPRAHEQIWRMLAASSTPLLLNFSLRSTILYEKERERLFASAEEASDNQEGLVNRKTLSALKQWNRDFVERRLLPWKKFFYLQIHLVSTGKLPENLSRVIGTSLTLSGHGDAHPGYRVFTPRKDEEATWRKKLKNLEPVFSGSYLPVPRLAEIADLEEIFAVMRLPYSPPDQGLPGVKFESSENNSTI